MFLPPKKKYSLVRNLYRRSSQVRIVASYCIDSQALGMIKGRGDAVMETDC